MYPQTDLAIASLIIADRMRQAEIERTWAGARASYRPRFAFSLRAVLGRRRVAGAVR